MKRRNFLKLGALFVPVFAAPTVAYSFLTAPTMPAGEWIIYEPGSFAWRQFLLESRAAEAAMRCALLGQTIAIPPGTSVRFLEHRS